jgi:Uncharacterized protein conserved in bacteria (DUF2252)
LFLSDREAQMSFREDNDAFENWLREQCNVVEADLRRKHKRMRKDAFVFLRATYFRWAKKIEGQCPNLCDAPHVLCVGDVHLENYGTWRDAEGRLVWGINDFDEAASMPYLFDLVRLATSAWLAPGIKLSRGQISRAILAGYRKGLADPHPALLDQREDWMRPYAVSADQGSAEFWKEVSDYPDAKPDAKVMRALKQSLPKGATVERFCSRVAGGGGLGRPRYVVVAKVEGGLALREAKALVPSAWLWAHNGKSKASHLRTLAFGRYRAPDPFLDSAFLGDTGGFVIRRLAPDSRKIELGDRPGTELSRLKTRLLSAMGHDLASIHAASAIGVKALRADLRKRPQGWLGKAAKTMSDLVESDYRAWKKK